MGKALFWVLGIQGRTRKTALSEFKFQHGETDEDHVSIRNSGIYPLKETKQFSEIENGPWGP